MAAKLIAREEWSRIGFILATIGSAVGLGNIWRFPYMAGANGGGAFLIPYIIGVVFFALPMMILMLHVGRKFKGSAITTLKKINPKFWVLGIIPLFLATCIISYYLVVTGWTLAYFIFSMGGYVEFNLFRASLNPLIFFVISLALTAVIVSKGIKRGIERASMILMPIFIVLLAGLAIYSMTLPGAFEGLGFYLSPDLSYLFNAQTWAMAFAQAFFSLSVGYGIILTYGSYLGKHTKIGKYASGIAGTDTLIALVGGLLIFPIVFSFGVAPTAGPELSFVTLPAIFQTMAFGFIIGSLFFFLLFIAAVTSAVSILEVGVAGLVDEIKWSRRKSVALLSILVFCLGVPSALTYYGEGFFIFGEPWLEFMDEFFGELILLASAIFAIVLTWFYRPIIFPHPSPLKRKLRIPQILNVLLKYIIPVVLLLILLLNLIT
jgi:NSS family neurotransmitter:Na+ symporter